MIPEPGMKVFSGPNPPSVIDPRSGLEGVMLMTQSLLRGEIVAMMGDRIFGSDHNTVAVQFLGGTVQFPITAYRLASATGVPVLVMTAPKITRIHLRASRGEDDRCAAGSWARSSQLRSLCPGIRAMP